MTLVSDYYYFYSSLSEKSLLFSFANFIQPTLCRQETKAAPSEKNIEAKYKAAFNAAVALATEDPEKNIKTEI